MFFYIDNNTHTNWIKTQSTSNFKLNLYDFIYVTKSTWLTIRFEAQVMCEQHCKTDELFKVFLKFKWRLSNKKVALFSVCTCVFYNFKLVNKVKINFENIKILNLDFIKCDFLKILFLHIL